MPANNRGGQRRCREQTWGETPLSVALELGNKDIIEVVNVETQQN